MKFTDWLWVELGVTIQEFSAMSASRQKALMIQYLDASYQH